MGGAALEARPQLVPLSRHRVPEVPDERLVAVAKFRAGIDLLCAPCG